MPGRRADRAGLAAAQIACDAQDWQLCINTSERTKAEIDIAQRYPTPYRDEIVARSKELDLDAPYVMGLIRQSFEKQMGNGGNA